jgi:hypothetical protein
MALALYAVFIEVCGNGQIIGVKTPAAAKSNPSWFVANEIIQLGELGTNGLKCELTIRNSRDIVGRQPPVCFVSVLVTVTNDFRNPCWRAYDTNYLEIELLDSSGKPVERTARGQNYRHFPTDQQFQDLFKEKYHQSHRLTVQGFGGAGPSPGAHGFTVFSIPDIFQLKTPGEYTLHVKMRLLAIDLARPLGEKLKIIPLPDVTAKIQLESNDIPLEELPASVQTNLPAK